MGALINQIFRFPINVKEVAGYKKMFQCKSPPVMIIFHWWFWLAKNRIKWVWFPLTTCCACPRHVDGIEMAGAISKEPCCCCSRPLVALHTSFFGIHQFHVDDVLPYIIRYWGISGTKRFSRLCQHSRWMSPLSNMIRQTCRNLRKANFLQRWQCGAVKVARPP